MYGDPIHLLYSMVISGMGLFMLGLANIAFRTRHPIVCACGHTIITSVSTGLLYWLDVSKQLTIFSGGILSAAGIFSFAIASGAIQTVIASMLALIKRPAIQASLMAFGGGSLIAFGMYRYECDEDQLMENDNIFMQQAVWKPNLHPIEGTVAYTDKGRVLELQAPDEIRTSTEMDEMEHSVLEQMIGDKPVIRLHGPDDRTNCHGWVFTGGKNWLPTDQVETILEDNGYRPVTTPALGDLAIFRDPNSNQVTHTSIVRILGGGSPIVESKWGWMGVFLHPVDQSCYGTNFTYYHTERENHLVATRKPEKSPASPVGPGESEIRMGGD